jgi:hypothetical protein
LERLSLRETLKLIVVSMQFISLQLYIIAVINELKLNKKCVFGIRRKVQILFAGPFAIIILVLNAVYIIVDYLNN